MTEHSEQEFVTSVPESWANLDYVVHRGQYYRVARNDHKAELYLVEVDEIPGEYWDRWEGGNE